MSTENVTDGPGRIPRDATPLLAMLLTDFQKLWDAMWAEDKPEIGSEQRHMMLNRQVELFGQAYLLGVLRAANPKLADEAAEFLAEQWDAGDSLGEWMYVWQQQLAAGQPLDLGIDIPEVSRG